MSDQVILVNENDEPVGAMDKMEAHRQAKLHRAFSVFIFNGSGEMLLQQRADGKYHSGGLWTNACCSHPAPGEETLPAANRRLREEMGFNTPIVKIFDFVYKATFANGLTEYEYDHVFLGVYSGDISPDPAEVQDYCHKSLNEIREDMADNPDMYTAWFHIAIPLLEKWLVKNKLETNN
ncbi:MAG TPA: isopentenyl-diphosphate Delta-isomerase [Chitinophagaceae bacterium]|nr:isopentenyl-diphosphate Delta-isomerase [Chitinophagaceae bacterium]